MLPDPWAQVKEESAVYKSANGLAVGRVGGIRIEAGRPSAGSQRVAQRLRAALRKRS